MVNFNSSNIYFCFRGDFIILYLIFLLLIISIILIIISKSIKQKANSIKKQHNIQQGKITYSDLNKPGKPFFSRKYRITGKPDYIIQKSNRHIPVELKTSNQNEPQQNHVFQLASYCALLEEYYGGFVPYGILVYNNLYQYKIPFDPKIRFELESTIHGMRNSIKTGRISINHSDPRRCKSCSMKEHCNNKIL